MEHGDVGAGLSAAEVSGVALELFFGVVEAHGVCEVGWCAFEGDGLDVMA